MFCDKYFKSLTQSILNKPSNEITLISTHLLYNFSQDSKIVQHIIESPYKNMLENVLQQISNQINQLISYGSYFNLLLGIIINFTVQQPQLLSLKAETSNLNKLLNQDLDQKTLINILYYLQQITQNRQNVNRAIINNTIQLLKNQRQQSKESVLNDTQIIKTAASILFNSFLHLKDNYDDKQLIQLFEPTIENLIILFTTQNYYGTYLESLKDNEKEFGQQIQFMKESNNQFSVDILSKLTDCLYLFVRADKTFLKQYYPLLRETHLYYTSLYGQCELNDQLNAVISHVVSE